MVEPAEPVYERLMRLGLGPLLGALILVAAAVIGVALYIFKPQPVRVAFPETAPIVELAPLEKAPHTIDVVGFGNVRASEQVSLRPQVAGMVVETSAALKPGGRVAEGDVLLRIDARDYRLAVERQEARLAQAEAALALERGQQAIAQTEWDLISKRLDSSVANRALALREPQLQQARANLAQSRSDLEVARLNLERTTLSVPFNAVVISESVDVGDVVSVGQEVAVLAGTNAFWVEVQFSQEDASRLAQALAGGDSETLPATVVEPSGENRRPAKLVSLLSNLASGSRLATGIVQIDDPLLIRDGADVAASPIFLGSYVEVHIEAGQIRSSYAIPSAAMHENNTVWVRDADCGLAFRAVRPILAQRDVVYVDADFEPGDTLVLTRIARAVPGMRIITAPEATEQRRQRAGGGGAQAGGTAGPGGAMAATERPGGPPGPGAGRSPRPKSQADAESNPDSRPDHDNAGPPDAVATVPINEACLSAPPIAPRADGGGATEAHTLPRTAAVEVRD